MKTTFITMYDGCFGREGGSDARVHRGTAGDSDTAPVAAVGVSLPLLAAAGRIDSYYTLLIGSSELPSMSSYSTSLYCKTLVVVVSLKMCAIIRIIIAATLNDCKVPRHTIALRGVCLFSK